jgi:hypothetical protein
MGFVRHVSSICEEDTMSQKTPATTTDISDETSLKPKPCTVIRVPPARLPELGSMLVTTGYTAVVYTTPDCETEYCDMEESVRKKSAEPVKAYEVFNGFWKLSDVLNSPADMSIGGR